MGPTPKDFPMVIGTHDNVLDGRWPKDKVDLTGIWWIRWNNSDHHAIKVYNNLKMEILVSFAETTLGKTASEDATGEEIFPATMYQPAQLPRHWGYGDTLAGMAYHMLGHSLTWDPDGGFTYE